MSIPAPSSPVSISSNPIYKRIHGLADEIRSTREELRKIKFPSMKPIEDELGKLESRLGKIKDVVKTRDTPSTPSDPSAPTSPTSPSTPSDPTSPSSPSTPSNPSTPQANPDNSNPQNSGTPTPTPTPEMSENLEDILALSGDPKRFLKLYRKVIETKISERGRLAEAQKIAPDKIEQAMTPIYKQFGDWLKEEGYIKIDLDKIVSLDPMIEGINGSEENKKLKKAYEEGLTVLYAKSVMTKYESLSKNQVFTNAGQQAKKRINEKRGKLELLLAEDNVNAREADINELYNTCLMKKIIGKADVYKSLKGMEGLKEVYETFNKIELPPQEEEE